MGHIESKNKGLLAGKFRNCVTGRTPNQAPIIDRKKASPRPLGRSKKKWISYSQITPPVMDPKGYGNASQYGKKK